MAIPHEKIDRLSGLSMTALMNLHMANVFSDDPDDRKYAIEIGEEIARRNKVNDDFCKESGFCDG